MEAAPEQQESIQNTFEAQLSNRQSLKTPEGYLTFVDIEPDGEIQDPTPLVVIPGWAITLRTQNPLLSALHASNEHLVAVEFPRSGGNVENKDGIPAEVIRRAHLIAELIRQRPEDQLDIVGQSMAAMALLAAAKIEPQILSKIRNVILVSPAGISGDDNFVKLVGRYLAGHLPQDTASLLRGRWNMAVMSLESSKYIGKNPLRTLKEASAISRSDDYDALQVLKDAGVRVALMQGQTDRLTPTTKLWRRIGKSTQSVFEKVDKTPEGEDPKSAFEKTGATPSGFRWKGPNPQNNPPFDVITMVSGGHDNRIYGDSTKFARKILEELDFLNKSPKTTEPATASVPKV